MAKGQSPLLGYNTNVRHKGRVYHIQTEDSGVQHPHVITHLFADGGRILKSNKTSYNDLLEAPDLQVRVKKIMQDQHKAMFIALRDGQFDHLVDPDTTLATAAVSANGTPVGAQPPAAAQAQGAAVPPPVPAAATAGATGAGRAVPPPPPSPARAAVPPPVPRASTPGIPRPSVPSPAPTPTPIAAAAPSAVAPSEPGERPSALPGGSPSGRSGRYAPVRAPEVLNSFKTKPESTSIFGDGLMSEKSLDEVILAYLADDLDDKKS